MRGVPCTIGIPCWQAACLQFNFRLISALRSYNCQTALVIHHNSSPLLGNGVLERTLLCAEVKIIKADWNATLHRHLHQGCQANSRCVCVWHGVLYPAHLFVFSIAELKTACMGLNVAHVILFWIWWLSQVTPTLTTAKKGLSRNSRWTPAVPINCKWYKETNPCACVFFVTRVSSVKEILHNFLSSSTWLDWFRIRHHHCVFA